MMNNDVCANPGIPISVLPELAKKYPSYSQMFLGLTKIDSLVRDLSRQIICSLSYAPDEYFIKTELQCQCYNLFLFKTNSNAIVGTSWTIIDFLDRCSNKLIEADINERINKMLAKFDNKCKNIQEGINWIS